MGEEPERRLLASGRGALLIEDFGRATGLDQVTLKILMRTELREAALWRDEDHKHPFGLFDDMLPSREALAAMGLRVRDDYDPDALRGTVEADEDDEPGSQGPAWSMP